MQESVRSARRQRMVAVIAPPLVVIAFVLALSDSMQRRRDSTEAVQQTYRIIGHVDALRTRLVDAETGQRGYILSADTAYLRPYRHAAADARVLLGRLRRETRDTPAQQRSLDTLDALVRTRFALLEGRISALRDEGAEAARLGLVASGGGRDVMDEIRRVLAAMDETERRLLERREAAQEAYGRHVLWTMLAGAALVAGVALLTNALFSRQAREQEALNDELQQSNAILQEQAAELEVQAEELQTQSAHQQEMMAELEAGSEEMQAQRAELERLAAQLAAANRELESANGELQQRTEEAEAANRAKTDFLSAMSHELRTPLNAIAGYVDLMDLGVHGPLTGAQQTCLERIRQNEHHLLTLITDILNFARIEAGRIEVRTADVPVAELLDEVAAVVEPLVAERELVLRTVPCGPAAHVRGDRDRIAQILLNLLTNAVKCTEAGGEIHLDCESGGGRTAIHVRDTGRGIAPDRHEAIFEPFVQVTPERTLAQGVGLGLSISRDLARAMGGELSVRSAPGQGSTFTLTLPTAIRIAVERIVHEDERVSAGPE